MARIAPVDRTRERCNILYQDVLRSGLLIYPAKLSRLVT
jgi:hypothetical protein